MPVLGGRLTQETLHTDLMKQPCRDSPGGKKLQVMSRSGGSHQPTTSKKLGPQSHNYKEVNSANNLRELGSEFFHNQASR